MAHTGQFTPTQLINDIVSVLPLLDVMFLRETCREIRALIPPLELPLNEAPEPKLWALYRCKPREYICARYERTGTSISEMRAMAEMLGIEPALFQAYHEARYGSKLPPLNHKNDDKYRISALEGAVLSGSLSKVRLVASQMLDLLYDDRYPYDIRHISHRSADVCSRISDRTEHLLAHHRSIPAILSGVAIKHGYVDICKYLLEVFLLLHESFYVWRRGGRKRIYEVYEYAMNCFRKPDDNADTIIQRNRNAQAVDMGCIEPSAVMGYVISVAAQMGLEDVCLQIHPDLRSDIFAGAVSGGHYDLAWHYSDSVRWPHRVGCAGILHLIREHMNPKCDWRDLRYNMYCCDIKCLMRLYILAFLDDSVLSKLTTRARISISRQLENLLREATFIGSLSVVKIVLEKAEFMDEVLHSPSYLFNRPLDDACGDSHDRARRERSCINALLVAYLQKMRADGHHFWRDDIFEKLTQPKNQ